MGRVEGKVALVTGAASGIGRGCALALAREGAFVVATDVQVAMVEETVGLIAKAGGKASARAQDVTSEGEWAAVIGEIGKAHGRLDILVNNAGIAVSGMVTDLSLDDWRRQMAVNVDSVFLGTRAALPLMRKDKTGTKGGSIINISSIAGLRGSARLSAYCASKGAVRLFSKAVAIECATLKDGVRVNSVHPGIIDTPIWGQVVPGTNEPLDLDAMSAFRVPLGVKGVPADIANAVLFLASDESRYMTGEEMVVDGGMTVGSVG